MKIRRLILMSLLGMVLTACSNTAENVSIQNNGEKEVQEIKREHVDVGDKEENKIYVNLLEHVLVDAEVIGREIHPLSH